MRAVRVRTLPCEPSASANLATLSPLGVSQIAVARRKIDLFDLNPHFLGQILSGFGSLGGILDRTDSLVGPVEQTHECGHAVLRVATQRHRGPPRRAVVNLWVCEA